MSEIQEAVLAAKAALSAVTVEMIDAEIENLTKQLVELRTLRAAKTGESLTTDAPAPKKERKKRTPKVAAVETPAAERLTLEEIE